MSGKVKYPFHVRHNGVDYNPGAPIEVENPEEHVLHGATKVINANVEDEMPRTQAQSAHAAKTSRRKSAK